VVENIYGIINIHIERLKVVDVTNIYSMKGKIKKKHNLYPKASHVLQVLKHKLIQVDE
jgi:hypothetical protein